MKGRRWFRTLDAAGRAANRDRFDRLRRRETRRSRGWRQAASFKGRASVSTWLLAIARYKALSARRRRIDAELDARIASTIADPADDPEAALQKKNRSELLRDSLAQLSPKHGEVIDLVYYHGKSVKEVADIVGVAEATVKTRMFYARKKLAELVET